MNKRLIIYLGLSVFATACGGDSSWEGIVYPDRSDLTEFRSIGDVLNYEECEAAAICAEEAGQQSGLKSNVVENLTCG